MLQQFYQDSFSLYKDIILQKNSLNTAQNSIDTSALTALQTMQLEQMRVALGNWDCVKTRNPVNDLIFDTDEFQAYRYIYRHHMHNFNYDTVPDYLKRILTTSYTLIQRWGSSPVQSRVAYGI